MKALVYGGPGIKDFVEKEKPKILHETDVIVKIVHTTICGTDLHILKGDVPAVKPGTTLGHEGVGIVDKIGSAVTNFKVGDRVLISCISACYSCENCKKGLTSHCNNGGGWILGHLIDGTQAEYVRIPFADNSLYHLPKEHKEANLVMLSDIFPTGFEIGVLNGKVFPGCTIAIVGAGPIGLAALLTAKFFSPSEIIMVDLDDERLKVAKQFGATKCVNSSKENVVQAIMQYTDNKGVDVAMEAVGIPATFDICQSILTPGGYLSVVGVHGKSVDFHLEKLWIQNVTITTGLVNATSTPMLLNNVKSQTLKPENLITHHFKSDDILTAYDVFANAATHKALKVIISFS